MADGQPVDLMKLRVGPAQVELPDGLGFVLVRKLPAIDFIALQKVYAETRDQDMFQIEWVARCIVNGDGVAYMHNPQGIEQIKALPFNVLLAIWEQCAEPTLDLELEKKSS